jgi:hypothetical protein
VAWGADQAQQPHAVVVWAWAGSSDGNNGNRPGEHPPISWWSRMSLGSDGTRLRLLPGRADAVGLPRAARVGRPSWTVGGILPPDRVAAITRFG